MSKVVIFGITGYAGTHIANELLERGHEVVGVARNPADATPRENLELKAGSVYDSEFVAKTVQGADAVVIATRPMQADGLELAKAVAPLLTAAEEAGARVGVVGGAASLYVAEGGPLVIDAGFPEDYRAEAEAHARMLDALRNADTTVSWFYVSPPGNFGSHNPGTKTGTFRLGTDILLVTEDGRTEISGADFATAFADEIEKPAHHQARFTLGY
jgi:putative NADH-flavin reductase